jgi:hypothetical protein
MCERLARPNCPPICTAGLRAVVYKLVELAAAVITVVPYGMNHLDAWQRVVEALKKMKPQAYSAANRTRFNAPQARDLMLISPCTAQLPRPASLGCARCCVATDVSMAAGRVHLRLTRKPRLRPVFQCDQCTHGCGEEAPSLATHPARVCTRLS